SRRASSRGHELHAAPPCIRRMTSNRTKSSSHQAHSCLKRSKRLRPLSFFSKKFCAARRRSGSLQACTSSKLIRSPAAGGKDACPKSSQPCSASLSRLTRKGLPAKVEVAEYGELFSPGGESGKTCHRPWRARARKSANAYASGPRSP